MVGDYWEGGDRAAWRKDDLGNCYIRRTMLIIKEKCNYKQKWDFDYGKCSE